MTDPCSVLFHISEKTAVILVKMQKSLAACIKNPARSLRQRIACPEDTQQAFEVIERFWCNTTHFDPQYRLTPRQKRATERAALCV